MAEFDPVFRPIFTLLSIVSTLSYFLFLLGLICLALALLALFLTLTLLLVKYRILRSNSKISEAIVVGFFHPYCNAGGGGERVLWVAIRAFQKRFPTLKSIIYTGDLDAAPDQILSKANSRFNVLGLDSSRIEFVYLHKRPLVEAEKWPMFTLLGQSIGSIFLGLEALDKSTEMPDLYIDTMGYAFTLPLFKYLGKCAVGCYVHYPTISTDMLLKVKLRRSGFNNRGFIAKSSVASYAKLFYYKVFSWLYGWAGRCSDSVMVNSSWTEDHINQIWRHSAVQKVYPPCDIEQFKEIPRTHKKQDTVNIVSLAQFRPEKDHPLQIRSFAKVRDKIYEETGVSDAEKDEKWEKLRLVLIGGCRNAEDEARVNDLRDLCKHLAVYENVEFKTNLAFENLKEEMGKGLIGLHTMWNEHFGIAVVEMLASGLVTLAHRSGGPLMDIVLETETNRNGFLAVHEEEYADAILDILEREKCESLDSLRQRARSSTERFSEREFEVAFVRATETIINASVRRKGLN